MCTNLDLVIVTAIKMCDNEMTDCHELATCTNTGAGTYKCTCNEGFTGDGKTCTGLFEKYKVLICVLFYCVCAYTFCMWCCVLFCF